MNILSSEETYKYLTNKICIDVWNDLSKRYNITTIESNLPSHIEENGINYTIFINYSQTIPEIFFHELLHLYIIDQKIHVLNELENLLSEKVLLSSYIEKDLIFSIHDSLSHMLMFYIYNKSGYNRSLFLGYKQKEVKLLNNKLASLKNNNIYDLKYEFSNFIHYQLSFNQFKMIGGIIDEQLQILKSNDLYLFNIINKITSNWSYSLSTEELRKIISVFICDLDNYIMNKLPSLFESE